MPVCISQVQLYEDTVKQMIWRLEEDTRLELRFFFFPTRLGVGGFTVLKLDMKSLDFIHRCIFTLSGTGMCAFGHGNPSVAKDGA